MITAESRSAIRIFLLLPIFFLTGCALLPAPSPMDAAHALKPVPVSCFPSFVDDRGFDGLADALNQSLAWLARIPPETVFRFGPDTVSRERLIDSLKRFLAFVATHPSPAAVNAFIRKNYRVYRSPGRETTGDVLFTGYYEPILNGSLTPDARYRYPVYETPDDLLTIDLSRFDPRFDHTVLKGRVDGKTVVPYYDRREIDGANALSGKARVLAWVDDPIGLFFLQIQGSGQIRLPDGSALQVHFAASNGRPYHSIGRELIDRGEIVSDQISMKRIRQWLLTHPKEADDILFSNPSYVFFQPEPEGPLGSLGVVLTPGRSIATDPRLFPPGALGFIVSQKPVVKADGCIDHWMRFSRFVLNQDTGGAIRGPGRVDLFWGTGSYAETAAGYTHGPGDLYFLVLAGPDPSSR